MANSTEMLLANKQICSTSIYLFFHFLFSSFFRSLALALNLNLLSINKREKLYFSRSIVVFVVCMLDGLFISCFNAACCYIDI